MAIPRDEFVRRAKLVRVIDADTLCLDIDLGFSASVVHHVRLTGVDAPEPRGVESWAGRYVTAAVENWIADRTDVLIRSEVFELGKFGRCLCEVWIGDECLNHMLLDRGLAWRTDGNGKIIGERSVEHLFGIPEGVKQKVREAMS